MKTTGLKALTKTLALTIATGLVVTAFRSHATKAPFNVSTIVPAARGGVKVICDSNKNYAISLKISNLAEPGRLEPRKKLYVVWMETVHAGVENIGQIVSGSGFMSKNLRASFETVSPSKPVKIFITAENDSAIEKPVSEVVLTTDHF
jgi:hypothetical protein